MHGALVLVVDFNECNGSSDEFSTVAARISVCDPATGSTGQQYFEDETCMEFDYEEVAAPSCMDVDTTSDSSSRDCSNNSDACSFVNECTDEGANCLSPEKPP